VDADVVIDVSKPVVIAGRYLYPRPGSGPVVRLQIKCGSAADASRGRSRDHRQSITLSAAFDKPRVG